LGTEIPTRLDLTTVRFPNPRTPPSSSLSQASRQPAPAVTAGGCSSSDKCPVRFLRIPAFPNAQGNRTAASSTALGPWPKKEADLGRAKTELSPGPPLYQDRAWRTRRFPEGRRWRTRFRRVTGPGSGPADRAQGEPSCAGVARTSPHWELHSQDGG